jgi:hypothetical protein
MNETNKNITEIHPLVALLIIIVIVFVIRFLVKKSNGWDPLTIPIDKNVNEFPIPFTITNQEEYFFGKGKYKLRLSRNGSLEIIRSSGFLEWSTPKQKSTQTGSVSATFNNNGVIIKRNLYTVWKEGLFIGKTNATKLLLLNNGILILMNDNDETVWRSHLITMF